MLAKHFFTSFVEIQIEDALKKNHHLQLLYDGNRISEYIGLSKDTWRNTASISRLIVTVFPLLIRCRGKKEMNGPFHVSFIALISPQLEDGMGPRLEKMFMVDQRKLSKLIIVSAVEEFPQNYDGAWADRSVGAHWQKDQRALQLFLLNNFSSSSVSL